MPDLEMLSSTEKLRIAQEAFHRVFRSADPFDKPFQSRIKWKLILYPVRYILDDAQFAALKTASGETGEVHAFISQIEGYGGGELFKEGNHWQMKLTRNAYKDLTSQREWTGLMESAIYSVKGRWGILISHEWHAVVGGTHQFIDSLISNLPDIASQEAAFLKYWKDNNTRLKSNINWVSPLLSHIYGQSKAKQMLREG